MSLQRAQSLAMVCAMLWLVTVSSAFGQAAPQGSEVINTVREKLLAGEVVIGGQMTTTDPAIARAMFGSGLDFIWVENQHSPYTYETLANIFMHTRGLPAIPLIRINEFTEDAAARPLDIGGLGVIFAMTNTRADAEQAVRICKFPPEGIRSTGGGQDRTVWGNSVRNNDNIMVSVMIETPEGVKNIDEILSVPGIDLLFIGNTDLGRFSGLSSSDPQYLAMVDTILAACKRHNVPVGRMCGNNPDTINGYIDQGYQFLCAGGESGFIRSGVQSMLEGIEK